MDSARPAVAPPGQVLSACRRRAVGGAWTPPFTQTRKFARGVSRLLPARGIIAAAVLISGILTAGAAGAQSAGGDIGGLSGLWNFGLDLKFDSDRFRTRGQLLTAEHFWDMRLNGAFDPGKLFLDGRAEEDGRGLDFRFEGEINAGFGRVPSF